MYGLARPNLCADARVERRCVTVVDRASSLSGFTVTESVARFVTLTATALAT
jgi:hypothetical protein